MTAVLRRLRHELDVFLCGRGNHRWTIVGQTKGMKSAPMVICARCGKPGWLL